MSNSFAVEDARKEAGYLQILFRLISLRDKKIITDAEFDRSVEYYKNMLKPEGAWEFLYRKPYSPPDKK